MSTEMTWEEYEKLQRDIQTGDPEKVELPGGQTLAEFKAEQAKAAREELKGTRAAEDAAMRAQSSATLPETVKVSVSDGGQIVAQPVFAAPGKPTETVSVVVSATGAKTEEREALRTGPLPEDFPHRELWVEGGFGTYEALRGADDETLLAVEGVGLAKLKESKAALKKS